MKTPPTLKTDARRTLDSVQVLERRVVWNLLDHLGQAGWKVTSVSDGDTRHPMKDDVEVMELVFDLDESWLYATKGEHRHAIFIVLGNDGYDAVADYHYFDDDRDGFNKLMEAFDGELYC